MALPGQSSPCQGWQLRVTNAASFDWIVTTTDDTRAGYDAVFAGVHAAVRDEDFTMLPQCGEGARHGQHDHMIIGRNEIAVQHMIKVFAQELGVALG